METAINRELLNALKYFGDKYFIEESLNKNKVIQALENYDEQLLKVFLSNETIKKYFTLDIDNHTIFETNKIIELFEVNDFWKNSYTKYTKKIGLTENGNFIDESTDVVLDFPYKDTILKASMSKETRRQHDELFLNEIIAKEEIDTLLAPKIFKNIKKYTTEGTKESKAYHSNDSLIIKGNNLLALYSLKNHFSNKIKMIYIDPPYNTGKDSFKYNDNFNRSSWLVFLKNRLEVAKELLKSDGLIMVQIDNNEQAYLKVLMDEVFGEHNFLTTLVWENKEGGGKSDSKFFTVKHEYILIYAKSIEYATINGVQVENENRYKHSDRHVYKRGPYYLQKLGMGSIQYSSSLDYPILAPDGTEILPKDNNRGNRACWRWSKEKVEWGIQNDYVVIKKDSKDVWTVYTKQYLKADNEGNIIKRTQRPQGVISKYSTTQSSKHLRDLFKNTAFPYSKPEGLISYLLQIGTNEGDLVMDFFLGSGTTAAVAHKMGRQYIGIEQMDYINTVTVPRLQKVIEGEQGGISEGVSWQGGGSFVYAELMEKNSGFITMIQEAKDSIDLRKVFDFMLKEAEIDFRVDLEEVDDSLHELSFENQKKTLFAIIDKNQLYYNYSEIDDANVRDLISDTDYAFNKSFYEGENK